MRPRTCTGPVCEIRRVGSRLACPVGGVEGGVPCEDGFGGGRAFAGVWLRTLVLRLGLSLRCACVLVFAMPMSMVCIRIHII
jgi:hypothetical protein